MAKAQGPYPPEFRQQIVEPVRAGETPTKLARENSCSVSTIRNWINQADQNEGRRSDPDPDSEDSNTANPIVADDNYTFC